MKNPVSILLRNLILKMFSTFGVNRMKIVLVMRAVLNLVFREKRVQNA